MATNPRMGKVNVKTAKVGKGGVSIPKKGGVNPKLFKKKMSAPPESPDSAGDIARATDEGQPNQRNDE